MAVSEGKPINSKISDSTIKFHDSLVIKKTVLDDKNSPDKIPGKNKSRGTSGPQ